MSKRTCLWCGESIAHRTMAAKYCGKACTSKASRERDPSRHRRDQAKYRASANGKAARQRERHQCQCVCCGETWMASRSESKYCSAICRDYTRWGPRFSPWSPASRDVVLWKRPRPTVVAETPAPRQWVAGDCAWCGVSFVVQASEGRYCSARCSRKHGKAKRRGRERGASGCYTWAEVTRKWIDIGKVCAYCHAPTPNGALDPDHVRPLSRGGSNSITNVVPSCRPCNQDKGAWLLHEWQARRSTRGLDPRVLHPLLASGLTAAA